MLFVVVFPVGFSLFGSLVELQILVKAQAWTLSSSATAVSKIGMEEAHGLAPVGSGSSRKVSSFSAVELDHSTANDDNAIPTRRKRCALSLTRVVPQAS